MKKFFHYISLSFISSFLVFVFLSPAIFADNPVRPPIFIKAINPGYTVDGKANVGELIELFRSSSDTPFSLAGLVLGYTNSSGNFIRLLEFPEHSWMTGESILLRLAGSDEPADLAYTKTLALKAGPLELIYHDEVIDSVCWTGREPCYKEFKSINPTTLVRDSLTFQFSHVNNYQPIFNPEQTSYYEEKLPDETPPRQCQGLQFSEILSFYESSPTEQFIEFYNSTTESILLDGCQLKYKNKFYPLSGIIQPENYFTYFPSKFRLTKNPVISNSLDLIDTDGSLVNSLSFYNGQVKATSFAYFGSDATGQAIWKTTFDPTPGSPNHYQEFKTCPSGKVLNMDTGNCVKPVSLTEKICGPNQYLNPLTGRCKSYPTSTAKVCQPGYTLNPLTGRCKKIIHNTGADHAIKTEPYTKKSSFIAFFAIIITIAIGLIYIIYEFRTDLKKLFDKVFRRVH